MATIPTQTHPLLSVPFNAATDFTILADHCENFADTLIESDDPALRLALCGRLDIDGVTSVEMNFTNVVSAKGKPAIVDMTEVSFIASLGMRMLLSAAKALRANGAKLVIYNPQPVVLEALQTAGFAAVMPIENDFSKALTLLKNA